MRPKIQKTSTQSVLITVIVSAFLGACGGGGNSSSSGGVSNTGTGSSVPSGQTSSFSIRGTATGLNGGVLKLQNNGADTQTLTSDNNFQFSSASVGSSYSVTVSQHPVARQCVTANASGTVTGNVSNVTVTCSPGQVSTLYSFASTASDGKYPAAGLIEDKAGNLFGTTSAGGTAGMGTVFKLSRNSDGTFAPAITLYSFTGTGSDGKYPNSGLIVDSVGNLLGTTNSGGSANVGTVFELSRNSDGTYATAVTLHSFTGTGSDGASPDAGLIPDSNGNLFGTTNLGGTTNSGTVYEVGRNGDGTYAAAITIYSFTGTGSDGKFPEAGLILDEGGNLFGTTSGGGTGNNGTVFELKRNSNGTYAAAITLHSFTGTGSDGATPNSVLAADTAGNLFGTTSSGGVSSFGTVFEILRNVDGTYASATTLHSFAGSGSDGAYPDAGLILDGAGNLFGTTNAGGSANEGTVFELKRIGDGSFASNITLLYSFTGIGSDGKFPSAGLIADSSGNLFGTTNSGGSADLGTVFKLN